MTTRTVTGDVHFLDDSAVEGDTVRFRLERVGFAEDAIYMPSDVDTTVQADGTIVPVDLWASGEGGRNLLCILPNGYTWKFRLDPGATSISLQELHALNAPLEPEVSPTIQNLLTEQIDAAVLAERARYASTTPGLGADLVGFEATLDGSVPRTVADRLGDLPLTPADVATPTDGTDARVGLQQTLDAGNLRRVELPNRDFVINSFEGAGREAVSLLMNGSGLHLVGGPKTRILVQDGAPGRSSIMRGVTDCILENIQFIDQRTNATAGSGLCIENSSRITVRNCRFENWPAYGVVVSEDTSTFVVQSSAISIDGPTQQIRGTAGMFTGVVAGNRLYLANTAFNDGLTTALSVSVDGSIITCHVVEPDDITLVTEAAGASSSMIVDNTISFSGNTMRIVNGNLNILDEDDFFTVAGSDFNDGPHRVVDVAIDGLELTITGTFVAEDAGAEITIQRIGRPTVTVWNAEPCDDITVEYCHFKQIGRIALTNFPKKVSKNLRLVHNTFEGCGRDYPAGTSIKAGTNEANYEIAFNTISYSNMGINLGNFRNGHVHDNHFVNGYERGIAVTCSTHPKAPLTHFGKLLIETNTFDFVAVTEDDFNNPNLEFHEDQEIGAIFIAPVPHAAVVNINGIVDEIDALIVRDNTANRWGADETGVGHGGIQVSKSHRRYTNIKVYDNILTDSGAVSTDPLDGYTVTTTSGNPWLTAVLNTNPTPDRLSIAGWAIGSEPIGDGIPEGAQIAELDVGGNRMRMTMNATASATGVAIRTATPLAMEVIGNDLTCSADTSTDTMRISSDGARVEYNTVRGFGPYAFQGLGATQTYRGNVIIEPNRADVANRGAFAMGTAAEDTGTYALYGNVVDLGTNGNADYLVNSTNAGVLYTDDNIFPDTMDLIVSGGTEPTPEPIYHGNYQTTRGTAAPTTGGHLRGHVHINTQPSATKAIAFWICVAGGTPGTFIALGHGRGTTAQRPADLTVGDAEYGYYDTSIQREIRWNGTAWVIPSEVRTMFRATAGRTVGNSTAESTLVPSTAVGSLAVVSSYLASGTSIRIDAQGTIRTTGTPTLRLRFKYGSTTIVDTGAVTMPTIATAAAWRMTATITGRTAGASGIIAAALTFVFHTAAGAVSTQQAIDIPQAIVNPFDTTAAGTLGITAQWGTADALNTMTTNLLLAEDMG